jgi:alkylhydroperoxidase family enzyme
MQKIGKYELLEELGRVVALKVLHPGYGEKSEVTQRFHNEARQVAQLFQCVVNRAQGENTVQGNKR